MVPPDPGPRHNVSPLGYSGLLTFHICLLFPHLVKFLANTMQFNTTCNDYDSINQHSHQSTNNHRSTGGGGVQTMTTPKGGRGRSDAGVIYNMLLYGLVMFCMVYAVAALEFRVVSWSNTKVLRCFERHFAGRCTGKRGGGRKGGSGPFDFTAAICAFI